MKYLLLMYSDEQSWTEEEMANCYRLSADIARELAREGKCLATNPLHSVNTATSVQLRNGKAVVTDGPFAETREQLGGYFLLDVPDLDEAIAIACRFPGALKGTVEIRPVLELPNLPQE